MKPSKKLSDLPPMNDEELGKFWAKNEPEDFEGDLIPGALECLTENPSAQVSTEHSWCAHG